MKRCISTLTKKKHQKNNNNNNKISKHCFEDQHLLHIQQEFSRFLQNYCERHSEEQYLHPNKKKKKEMKTRL